MTTTLPYTSDNINSLLEKRFPINEFHYIQRTCHYKSPNPPQTPANASNFNFDSLTFILSIHRPPIPRDKKRRNRRCSTAAGERKQLRRAEKRVQVYTRTHTHERTREDVKERERVESAAVAARDRHARLVFISFTFPLSRIYIHIHTHSFAARACFRFFFRCFGGSSANARERA